MVNFSPLGIDLWGNPVIARSHASLLGKRFVVPPFTVLNARGGDWQARKRAWAALGVRGEIGRSAKSYNIHRWMDGAGGGQRAAGDGTSIFDPVLCEVVYRWFSREGAQVVDPFAGGSVRGIVASMLGRNYWGCDLRAEQIEANREQASMIRTGTPPRWVCGDAVDELEAAPDADLVFSCPPYGDLEEYSDDPCDLSRMEWHTFCAAYRRIILRACAKLIPNRFACFVVGDFRDEKGYCRDFVGLTVAAFREGGCALYNEAVFVTPVGSAAVRATNQFEAGRKLCKTHQNVLVFCKGDWRKAADEAGGA